MELPDITDGQQILSKVDLVTEAVPCPEWGCTVYVRVMDGTARDAFDAGNLIIGDDNKMEPNFANMRARLCALTMCRKDGTLLFGVDDVEAIGGKSAVALERVYTVARRLNKLNKEDTDFFTVPSNAGQNSASRCTSANGSAIPAGAAC